MKNNNHNRNDSAVSPVIGVILMVAITVIMAAVIAAFVFGMSGNVSKTKIVAVTVSSGDGENLTAMLQGGQDAASVNNLTMSINEGTPEHIHDPVVGSTLTMQGTAGKDHVVIVAGFSDGQDQVIYDAFH